MVLDALIERLGEPATWALGALCIGLVFGFMAQRSRFCLRSAVIECARQQMGGKLTVWLFAFATAVGATQLLALAGWFDASSARQLAARGSLSGAAIGGLLFGIGMVLARGCSSRLLVLAALLWARRQKVPVWGWAEAIGVGLAVAAAWWFTCAVMQRAFDPHPLQALSFTGPSAEVLNRVLFVTDRPWTFDLGLVPGVFLGSFIAAALFGELKLEGFQGGVSMRRYIVGAMAMGFGGMLAGGCAVGAGLSGAAVFTMSSWVSLCAMWAGAALTNRLIDQAPAGAPPDTPVPAPRPWSTA